MTTIRNRWNGEAIYSGEHDTIRAAVEVAKIGANLSEASLRGANLSVADLSEASLSVADLRGADLRGADLRGADLRGAYLGGADLGGADLGGADLVGANLVGANLVGANLGGAKFNWRSHDLIAEVLRRAAGTDAEKRKITGGILVSRDWCWDQFLKLDDPLAPWAIETLAAFVMPDDGAPAVLREAARKLTAAKAPAVTCGENA